MAELFCQRRRAGARTAPFRSRRRGYCAPTSPSISCASCGSTASRRAPRVPRLVVARGLERRLEGSTTLPVNWVRPRLDLAR